jgi:hypothetical protein
VIFAICCISLSVIAFALALRAAIEHDPPADSISSEDTHTHADCVKRGMVQGFPESTPSARLIERIKRLEAKAEGLMNDAIEAKEQWSESADLEPAQEKDFACRLVSPYGSATVLVKLENIGDSPRPLRVRLFARLAAADAGVMPTTLQPPPCEAVGDTITAAYQGPACAANSWGVPVVYDAQGSAGVLVVNVSSPSRYPLTVEIVVAITLRKAVILAPEAASLGEIAYAGYLSACGGKSLISGHPLPAFGQQAPEIGAAWQAAAVAVRDRCVQIVEQSDLAGPSFIGPLHGAGWSGAIEAAVRRLRGA